MKHCSRNISQQKTVSSSSLHLFHPPDDLCYTTFSVVEESVVFPPQSATGVWHEGWTEKLV